MAPYTRISECYQLDSQSEVAGRPSLPTASVLSLVNELGHPLSAQCDPRALYRHLKPPQSLERMDYTNIYGQLSIPVSSMGGNESQLTTRDPPFSNLPPLSPRLAALSEVSFYTTGYSMWRPHYPYPITGNGAASRQLHSIPLDIPHDPLSYGPLEGWGFDGLLYPWALDQSRDLDDVARARPRSFQAEMPLLVHQNVILTSEAHPPSSFLKNPGHHDSYLATPTLSEDGSSFELEQGTLYRHGPNHHSPELGDAYRPSPSRNSTKSPHDQEGTYQSFTPTSLLTLDSANATRITDTESEVDENGTDEPYAKLIHRALLSAPGHRMVLKQIYDWFERHTDKPNQKNGSDKGWQNSIRHNLSMNGVSPHNLSRKIQANKSQAFKKVEQTPHADDSKKGYVWVLEDSAILEGVKSTTRYRKSGSNKKTSRSVPPIPSRQKSGRKGGRATKKSKFKRLRLSERQRAQRSATTEGNLPPGLRLDDRDLDGASYYSGVPSHDCHFRNPTSHPYHDHNGSKHLVEPEAVQYFANTVGWQSPVPPGQSLFYDDSECSEDGAMGDFGLVSSQMDSPEDSPLMTPYYLFGGSEVYSTAIESTD